MSHNSKNESNFTISNIGDSLCSLRIVICDCNISNFAGCSYHQVFSFYEEVPFGTKDQLCLCGQVF